MSFFALTFAVIRWWKVGDPLRRSHLSIFQVVLHSLVGFGVAALTSFPLLWGLIMAAAFSLSVQLTSYRISEQQREEKLRTQVLNSANG